MINFGSMFGKSFRKAFKVVSVHSVNTILIHSGVNLTTAKEAAKDVFGKLSADATSKKEKATALLAESKVLFNQSKEIEDALNEISAAEGKV